MTTPRELDNLEILETAKSIVAAAQTSVKATMLVSEELERPLPGDYFLLLRKKMDAGVKITRVGFGSNEEVGRLTDKIDFAHNNYEFILCRHGTYKRMLLVDDSRLMFATETPEGKRFYYSEDPDDITDYLNYFEQLRA